jgi:two-component system cell cycle response regulator DivK
MKNINILIIDDNATNLKLIKVLLTLENYQVETAFNSEEALNVLKYFKPQIILMDIQLPGMNGLELTQLLKKNPQFRETVILALTAYAMKGDKEKALAAGCDGYITKPIDTRTFSALIRRYFTKPE